MNRAFAGLAAVSLGVVLAFLLLPLAALVWRVSPGEVAGAIASTETARALGVSARTSAIAHVLVLALGTPAAYLLATTARRGRKLAIALIELPLVLPPVVAGLALLALLGRRGPLGGLLDDAGMQLAFTQAAVVLAVAFVSAPFYVRSAIAAFEAVDPGLLAAARTLGAGPWKVFARVAVPLALPGLGAGSALAFARGLGEFGATIVFAGSFPGVTETLPLAIYSGLDRDLAGALAVSIVLLALSAAILVVSKTWPRISR